MDLHPNGITSKSMPTISLLLLVACCVLFVQKIEKLLKNENLLLKLFLR